MFLHTHLYGRDPTIPISSKTNNLTRSLIFVISPSSDLPAYSHSIGDYCSGKSCMMIMFCFGLKSNTQFPREIFLMSGGFLNAILTVKEELGTSPQGLWGGKANSQQLASDLRRSPTS